MTTEANASMKNVPDRIPLILEEDELEEWLYNDNGFEWLLY